MNVEEKPRRLSLSNVFDHDERRGTSASYDFSNSWTNGRVTSCLSLQDSLFKLSFTYSSQQYR